MPEGHTVHRIADRFRREFVGRVVHVSSPQGRFADGARVVDGRELVQAHAVGKQLFLEYDGAVWMRVHLGIYGAWDFFNADDADTATGSLGAPRRTRSTRMAETEHTKHDLLEGFPPEPVGQVRVRMLTDSAVADLRGPTACEVIDSEQVSAVIARLGPDPAHDSGRDAEDEFVRRVRAKASPIALLLMDQQVVSGIGNVYRAEILFRARLNPHLRGKDVAEDVVRALWHDWTVLLQRGIDTGLMLTMDDLDEESYRRAVEHRDDRHWVYKREGLPCRVCGTHVLLEMMAGRKLYWCPRCQAA